MCLLLSPIFTMPYSAAWALDRVTVVLPDTVRLVVALRCSVADKGRMTISSLKLSTLIGLEFSETNTERAIVVS